MLTIVSQGVASRDCVSPACAVTTFFMHPLFGLMRAVASAALARTPYQALVEELNAKSARATLDAEVALRDLVAGRLPSGGPALTALCTEVATHFGKGEDSQRNPTRATVFCGEVGRCRKFLCADDMETTAQPWPGNGIASMTIRTCCATLSSKREILKAARFTRCVLRRSKWPFANQGARSW